MNRYICPECKRVVNIFDLHGVNTDCSACNRRQSIEDCYVLDTETGLVSNINGTSPTPASSKFGNISDFALDARVVRALNELSDQSETDDIRDYMLPVGFEWQNTHFPDEYLLKFVDSISTDWGRSAELKADVIAELVISLVLAVTIVLWVVISPHNQGIRALILAFLALMFIVMIFVIIITLIMLGFSLFASRGDEPIPEKRSIMILITREILGFSGGKIYNDKFVKFPRDPKGTYSYTKKEGKSYSVVIMRTSDKYQYIIDKLTKENADNFCTVISYLQQVKI